MRSAILLVSFAFTSMPRRAQPKAYTFVLPHSYPTLRFMLSLRRHVASSVVVRRARASLGLLMPVRFVCAP